LQVPVFTSKNADGMHSRGSSNQWSYTQLRPETSRLGRGAGVVATNRVQEAYDLISSLEVNWRNVARNEVIAALIKADELDELPFYGKSMWADSRTVS
jgi:hypothetical protein